MQIMGIDASFTGTGVIILDDHSRTAYSEVIVSDPKQDIIARVREISNRVVSLYYDMGVNSTVIEGFAFARPQHAHQMGYLGYRIREALPSYTEVPPTSLKKFATGKGNCKKELILQQVYKRWGEEFDDNNLADAYVLARIGVNLVKKESGLTSFQEEVIKKLGG